MTNPIPEGFNSVTPILVFKDVQKAIDFYKKAFGAEEIFVFPNPNGHGVMHAEMKIGNSIIMMAEESMEFHNRSAETVGESPITLYLYVQNVDAEFKKAVEAGAQTVNNVKDMFWGDRTGTVRDPFNYCWTIATQTRQLTPEEIKRGAEAMFAQQMGKR